MKTNYGKAMGKGHGGMKVKASPKRVYGGKKMARGPKDPTPSHKGYRA